MEGQENDHGINTRRAGTKQDKSLRSPHQTQTQTDETTQEYIARAERWLVKTLDEAAIPRTPAKIAAALVTWSEGKSPSTYRQMRSALVTHQSHHGYTKAIDTIKTTERIGYGTATRKKRLCKQVTEEEHQQLIADAIAHKDRLMEAALLVAYYTGCRPVEFLSMQVLGCTLDGEVKIQINGAKKNEGQGRGMDKVILVDDSEVILHIGVMNELDGPDSDKQMKLIRTRVSKASKRIFNIRKRRPTLYSYRHQLGSELKAEEELSRQQAAAVMGHQSQDSIAVYGHANASKGGNGLKRAVPVASPETVKQVSGKPPRRMPARTPPSSEVGSNRQRRQKTHDPTP
jgi:integrase